MQRRLFNFAAVAMSVTTSSVVLARDENLRALKELSVDQPLDLEVTAVAKRSTPLAQAPTSIYVITADAIRRSGAATLAEALRLAPNLQFAHLWNRLRSDSAIPVEGNLLHDEHSEFGDSVSRSLIERDVIGQVQWHF